MTVPKNRGLSIALNVSANFFIEIEDHSPFMNLKVKLPNKESSRNEYIHMHISLRNTLDPIPRELSLNETNFPMKNISAWGSASEVPTLYLAT